MIAKINLDGEERWVVVMDAAPYNLSKSDIARLGNILNGIIIQYSTQLPASTLNAIAHLERSFFDFSNDVPGTPFVSETIIVPKNAKKLTA